MATHQKNHQKNKGVNNKVLRIAEQENGETYALIKRPLGVCQFEIELYKTGELLIASLCGTIKKSSKRQMVCIGDTVLILGGKPSIIKYKYSGEEVKKLYKQGEIKDFKTKTEASEITFEDENNVENNVENNEEIDDEFIMGI